MADHRAYVGLGSNIEPRLDYLNEAVAAFRASEDISLVQLSPCYESLPWGYTDQANFLNAVVAFQTSLTPLDLLDFCQGLEAQAKRKRLFKNGPRTLDVDILVYDQLEMETSRLTLPHPRLAERAFVLVPLNDLNPNLIIPKWERSVQDLLNSLSEEERSAVWPYQNETGKSPEGH